MGERLVVIGGTAAGLSAASKAKRMCPSMDITVYERSGFVSYGACGLPYFVGGMIADAEDLVSLNVQTLSEKRGIPTYTHHEVTSIDRQAKTVTVRNLDSGETFVKPYDKLVIATGATPIVPGIPGARSKGVHCLRTVEDGIALKARVAEGAARAVIIGGGFIGLETAEELTQAGMKVTVVEAMPRLLPFLIEEYASSIQAELERHGVEVCLNSTAAEVLCDENGKATGVKTSDGREFPADLVLFSIGVRPASDLARDCGLEIGFKGAIVVDEHQRTSDSDIYACGDCGQMKNLITGEPCYVPLGTTANKQGRIAGENLGGSNSTFKGVLGSQVTKIFEIYATSTGLTEAQAEQAGFAPAVCSITKNDRASYYPGGGQNHLTLVLDRHTGKLLGAQAIGTETVAGRMNVLATAITAGMTVMELNELDLVYSPSVAPVYDPILIAASQALKCVDKEARA